MAASLFVKPDTSIYRSVTQVAATSKFPFRVVSKKRDASSLLASAKIVEASQHKSESQVERKTFCLPGV